jgi:hypothetical protein
VKRLDYLVALLSTPPGKRLTTILVGLAIAIATGTTYVLVVPNPSGGPPLTTITVGGPHGTPTREIDVPKAAIEQAAPSLESGLRSENPEGVSNKVLDEARDYQDKLAANDQLPITTPDAAPQQRGCTTALVQNFSTRRGVAPREQVVHFTVSANRTGWSDVDAIVGLFDRPSFQASSHYVIDGEGHCKYIVRESDKAWTQAAANSFSIGYEIINTGHEPQFMGSAGLAKLAMVLSDGADRWKIPVQRGRVVNCIPSTPGITDHASLGPCGGGHTDIRPYSVPNVIAAVRAFRASTAKPARPKLYKIIARRSVLGPPPSTKIKQLVTTRPGNTVDRLVAAGWSRVYVVRPSG